MKVQWAMRRTAPNQYEGFVTLPIPVGSIPGRGRKGPMRIKASGQTPASALAKAASIADAIANNPVIASVLPPGSGVALKATKYLASAAKAGKLADAAANIVGPGAKRLAKALKFW